MLGEKFQTSATLPLLLKKLVYRRALNLILEDLDSKGYLLDSAIGEGIQILDVSSIMLDSEENFSRAQELRAKLTSSKTLLLLRKRS
jgi:hypothetical protein